MKRILILSSFLFFAFGAQSQILITLLLGDKLNSDGLAFGLHGGVNWSLIDNMDAKKSLSAFNLGFYFDIRLKNNLSLFTGVSVKATSGVSSLSDDDLNFLQSPIYSSDGEFNQHISYFLIPALIKYRMDNYIFFEVGPQFGLAYDAWVEFNHELDGTTTKVKDENLDLLNRFDFGFTGGLGYHLHQGRGMSLGVKYYQGLVDVYKKRSGTFNSSFFVYVNIPIGGPKASKEKLKEN